DDPDVDVRCGHGRLLARTPADCTQSAGPAPAPPRHPGLGAYNPAHAASARDPPGRGRVTDRPGHVRPPPRPRPRPRPAPRDRDPVAEPGTATGTPGDWWTVFANSPDVMEHACRGFALYASPKRKISPKLRELGQTRAGYLTGSQFVFSQHCKACRAFGFSEEKIEALKAWSTSELFNPLERALLAFTDALVLEHGRVPDAVFDVLREHLDDEQILEF